MWLATRGHSRPHEILRCHAGPSKPMNSEDQGTDGVAAIFATSLPLSAGDREGSDTHCGPISGTGRGSAGGERLIEETTITELCQQTRGDRLLRHGVR